MEQRGEEIGKREREVGTTGREARHRPFTETLNNATSGKENDEELYALKSDEGLDTSWSNAEKEKLTSSLAP